MSPTEALAIVREIYHGPAENKIITPLLERLRDAFPHAHFLDLIFHSPVELTPEQVVEEALRREAHRDRQE